MLFKNKWLELVWWAGRSCHHPCRSPACSSGEGPRAASPPSPRPSGSRDPVAQPFLTAVIVSVIISAQDLTGFCDSSLKKGFLAGYCFMALKGPRQGLVLASVVLGTGDRLSNLQRVWLYLGAVLGLGYLFLCKMPQYRRSELFSTEMWTEVTAGSHAVLVKWGSLAAAAGGLAGRGGEGRPGHHAGQSVQGAHCCQSPLVPCLAWLTAAAPRDPILPPSCMSSIAVPTLPCGAVPGPARPA